MTETKDPQDVLKLLGKYSKQLHMYAPDQLRNVLKISIDMARNAIEDSCTCEAFLSGYDGQTCLVIFPKDSGFRTVLPGDYMEMEVPCMDKGLKVYQAKVAAVMGRRGEEIYRLQDMRCVHQMERRRAHRFPMHINAEYCCLKDEQTKEAIAKGRILNISKTGLLMSSPAPLGLESDLAIRFEINWHEIWEDIIDVPEGVLGTIVREQKNGPETYPKDYKYHYGIKINSLGSVNILLEM